MIKKIGRGITKAVAFSAIGLASYDMWYRLSMPIHQSYNNIQALNTKVNNRISWVYEEDYHHVMSVDVQRYLNDYLHRGHFESEGLDIHYRLFLHSNDSETIIINHGFNEFQEKYDELIYYYLQAGYNVFSYDIRGHGFSKEHEDSTIVNLDGFEEYIFDLYEAVNTLDRRYQIKGPFVLFGHSMGGGVALAFAYHYPNLVKSLVLSSPMFNIDTSPFARGASHLMANLAILSNLSGTRIPFQEAKGISTKKYFELNTGLSTNVTRSHYAYLRNQDLHTHITQGGSMRWLRSSLNQVKTVAHPKYLYRIKTPILIFTSQSDRIVRNDGTYHASHYLPNVQLVEIKNVGHEIFQEGDEVVHPYVSKILDFIDGEKVEQQEINI